MTIIDNLPAIDGYERVDVVSGISRTIIKCWTNMTYQPLNTEPVLHYLYREHGCDLEFCSGVTSSYFPDESEDDPAGVALINTRQSPPLVVRNMAHELTHHVLFWWQDLGYPDYWNDTVAKLGTSKEMEERICHGVADLVEIVPGGFQGNGKIAIPRAPRVILRVYQPQWAEWARIKKQAAERRAAKR